MCVSVMIVKNPFASEGSVTYLNRKTISVFFRIGECSELLSLEDGFSVRIFALDEGARGAPWVSAFEKRWRRCAGLTRVHGKQRRLSRHGSRTANPGITTPIVSMSEMTGKHQGGGGKVAYRRNDLRVLWILGEVDNRSMSYKEPATSTDKLSHQVEESKLYLQGRKPRHTRSDSHPTTSCSSRTYWSHPGLAKT